MTIAPVQASQQLRDEIREQVMRLREVVDKIEELLEEDDEGAAGGNA
jgi:hypothetical protein